MRDWTVFLRERLNLPHMTRHWDDRVIRELADHMDDLYNEAVARGATEEAAQAHAERSLGDADVAAAELIATEPARVRAQVNRWAERGEGRLREKGGGWATVSNRIRDLRTTVRSLAKRPAFTSVVVLVLALGIGATTAIFTLLSVVVLSPLPYDNANRLVSIDHVREGVGRSVGQSAAWHFTYEAENRVFEDIGMYDDGSVTMIHRSGEPEVVPVLVVTSGVFRALRLNPVVGRLFTAEDEELDAPLAILLGHGYWLSRYGGDPTVVGQVVHIDDTFDISHSYIVSIESDQ